MLRTLWTPALALGAVLAVDGMASAAEPAKPGGGFTMTLGGQGTAAQAASSTEDTDLACCRRYRCGYGGWGGGWGGYYGGGYGLGYGGYGGGWGGYNSFSYYSSYRPYYHCRRPVYYSSYYSYAPAYYGGFGGGYGGYYGISGKQDDATAPVVSLNLAVAKNPAAPRTSAAAGQPQPADATGGFRYDGGPANPVPFPKPDATSGGAAAQPATGLPVSLPKAKPGKPYTYKAYGEK
jgi:hypothetical protein